MTRKKIIDGIQYSIAAIIFNDNKILMFERKGEDWETGWEFVKGAIHVGETPEEAAYREIDEEAGVKTQIIGQLPKTYWGSKPHKDGELRIHCTLFSCKYLSGKVKLGEPEHIRYKWMSLEEAVQAVWVLGGEEGIRDAFRVYKDFVNN